MKKKLLGVLLFVIIAVCAVCCFTACSNVAKLQMDEKYMLSSRVGDDDGYYIYFIFHSDGTGEYKRCSYNYDYTIKFKYTYVDKDKSAVVCFYDSVEYGEKHGTYKVETTWHALCTVSKNVIYSEDGACFINENYLTKTIPNFGSKTN